MRSHKITLLALLLSSVPAEFTPETNYPVSPAFEEKQTVTVSNSDSFAACACDLTAGACDVQCCCDPDCSSSLVDQWLQDPKKNCINLVQEVTPEPLSQCSNEIFVKKIEDV
jgi:hypothetical protein